MNNKKTSLCNTNIQVCACINDPFLVFTYFLAINVTKIYNMTDCGPAELFLGAFYELSGILCTFKDVAPSRLHEFSTPTRTTTHTEFSISGWSIYCPLTKFSSLQQNANKSDSALIRSEVAV